MAKRLLQMLGLMLFWLCLSAPVLGEGVTRALLVGCDEFVTQAQTTPSSGNNVERIAALLRENGIAEEALLLRKTGLGSADDLEALLDEAFSGASAEDTCIFYISTHGLWVEGTDNGHMAFVLSDGSAEDTISAERLKTLMDGYPGTHLLLLDVCFSGAVISKGCTTLCANLFAGDNTVVICSSGGAENSWFWSGYGEDGQIIHGAGYFSGALSAGLSASSGYAADENGDGAVTLSELKRFLLADYGASTVQTYPEESDAVLLRYDSDHRTDAVTAPLTNLCIGSDALSREDTELVCSFTVLRETRLAYQLVCRTNGRWDFANATLLWDGGEEGEALQPGYYERVISLSDALEDDEYGYALLQLLAVEDGTAQVLSSHVLCVLPQEGDPALSVETPAAFTPATGEELTFIVRHALPCELTVTVENEAGETVRRLASSAATRPAQLIPEGSSFTWTGLTDDGTMAPTGTYRIRVKTRIGGIRYETVSGDFTLE